MLQGSSVSTMESTLSASICVCVSVCSVPAGMAFFIEMTVISLSRFGAKIAS